MEYGQRQELQSADASERTTRMMRSVREILAEQGQEHLLDAANFETASEAVTMPPRPMPGSVTAACAAKKGGVQRPPHLSGTVTTAKPKPMPVETAPAPAPVAASVAQQPEKSRSLLSRLIGR
ncbi:MAG: hypothetical protein ABJX32_18890 [Tateyamaria sp.]|jgi:hypothetical protein|uniref:hypothetical protein n=1 Tax=unclassified Tateyamaria TaxID=2645127 RepID=UPI000D5588A2|nr:hypothetical protein [Tateyamaria sp. Alg231-49]